MERNMRKAFNKLQKMGCPVYEHPDDGNNFSIDAEHPESYRWCDYWNESSLVWDGETTNPKIDKVLNPLGLFAEWHNPGRIAVYNI